MEQFANRREVPSREDGESFDGVVEQNAGHGDSGFTANEIPNKDLDATRLYLKEIEFSELLTADEERFFARRAQRGDASARKRMIVCNLRLVVKIARRYVNRVWRCSISSRRGTWA